MLGLWAHAIFISGISVPHYPVPEHIAAYKHVIQLRCRPPIQIKFCYSPKRVIFWTDVGLQVVGKSVGSREKVAISGKDLLVNVLMRCLQ